MMACLRSPAHLVAIMSCALAVACGEKQGSAPQTAKDIDYYRANLEEAKTAVAACREKGSEAQGVELANCKAARFALMSPTESVKTGKNYSTALGGSK